VTVLRVDSRSFETHVPVLVVGAGACGPSAALAARASLEGTASASAAADIDAGVPP
jgi:succinate dehydrogenase/fumarate reductase flavoprotein subunit